jgi:hypothetical protein
MNVDAMIKTLQAEKEALDAAILVLERLASRHGRRRGRPPAWLQVRQAEAATEANASKPRKARKGFSEETKRKMAEAQRRRWAAARKGT